MVKYIEILQLLCTKRDTQEADKVHFFQKLSSKVQLFTPSPTHNTNIMSQNGTVELRKETSMLSLCIICYG